MCRTSPEILKLATGALGAVTRSQRAGDSDSGSDSALGLGLSLSLGLAARGAKGSRHVQVISHTAMVAPPKDDLQPETRMFGSTGENASAAGPVSAYTTREEHVDSPTWPVCGVVLSPPLGKENEDDESTCTE